MRITVFGANGKVGRLVVQEALRRGHTVIAFVHSKPLADQPNLTVRQGDIYEQKSVGQAIVGSNAVISALGSWGTPKKDVLTAAMQSLIPAAENAGLRRIVSLTGNVALAPGDKPGPLLRGARMLMRIAARKIIDDGEKHIALLAASNLQWTVVRAAVMNNLGNATYTLSAQPSPGPTINRRAVANSLVDLAEKDDWSMQAPFIYRR